MWRFIISLIIMTVAAVVGYIRNKRRKRAEFETERQRIYTIAKSFTNKSLYKITCERTARAKKLECLYIIHEEASCARNIEMNIEILSTSYYYKIIIQRLLDTYSSHNNGRLNMLQQIMSELEENILHLTYEARENTDSVESVFSLQHGWTWRYKRC